MAAGRVLVAPLFFVFGYLVQRIVLNRVITAPVLVTLTLTFGLDLILNNAMIYFFKADYRKLTLTPPMGSISLFGVVMIRTVDEWCEWHWYGHGHAQGVPGSVLSGHGSPHRTLNWPSS